MTSRPHDALTPSRRPHALTMLALVALAGQVGAQAAARSGAPLRSAEIRNVRYDVTYGQAEAERGHVLVTTTFDVLGSEPVLLSLPAWTPGAYEISDFARWVTDFSARAAGNPLEWDKVDPDSWRIVPGGAGSIAVSFTYVGDSLDNAMTWMRPDFLFFNGTNLFLYPEGRPMQYRSRVRVRVAPGWLVVTGMQPAAGGAPHEFTSESYHDLVDMPVFVGRFDIDSALVAGKWTRLATYPVGSMTGALRTAGWDWLKRTIPIQAALFGEVPWTTYTVFQIADSAYPGASGLEHQSSHVDVVNPLALRSAFIPSLYAHEIFHAWNVKRLRPADLWPYVYDEKQPTPWLWVSEGITDYYADLSALRGGIIDEAGFYSATAAKINEVMNAPAVALEDASLNTWVHPVDGTGYLYYPKGSLAGLLLDIMIRDASDGRRSLDDVMRVLYTATYKAGRGFTGDDWWNTVKRAAGGNGTAFDDFRRRYVEGRDAYPFERVFALAGLRISRAPTPRLGVSSQQDATGIRVMAMDSSGAAAAAGIRPGDYLVSVGGVAVKDLDFATEFRARFASAPEGTPLPITVRRGNETLTLAGTLRFAPGSVSVEPVPNAGARAVRVRSGLLRGGN